MWIDLKNIQWIKGFQKHFKHYNGIFKHKKDLYMGFKTIENEIFFEFFYINLDIII
jgi:hypothetical protein